MKTLSDHPGLIGRLLAADARRRERLARRRWFFRRLSWHLQWLCDGAVKWVLLPLVKLCVAAIIGMAVGGMWLQFVAR